VKKLTVSIDDHTIIMDVSDDIHKRLRKIAEEKGTTVESIAWSALVTYGNPIAALYQYLKYTK